MSFQTGLSGLNASSRSLDVIGNNIANANTTGMKASRTEFAGLIASSFGPGSSSGNGIGVEVIAISQQFSQGNISTTGNGLDVAINGGGFFQLTQPDGSLSYTRDGSFKLDKDGFIKSNSGANLMGYPTDKTGKATSASIEKLVMPTSAPIAANATTTITAEFNLDARANLAAGVIADPAAVPPIVGIPVTPRSTYGTSLNVYDAQGVATPMNFYFEKTAANTWDMYAGIDNPTAATPVVFTSMGQLVFDTAGKMTAPTTTITTAGTNFGKFGISIATPTTIPSKNPNDADTFLDGPLDIILEGASQFGSFFAVSNLTQDGYTAGELTGLNIGENGVITTRYSNGQTQSAGQVTLADFRNVQGLAPLGGNSWAATFASGLPVQGAPGVGKFGALRAGSLEESNIDLTSELVNMMTAQRAYQANAQTIKSQDQVLSTLVNLR